MENLGNKDIATLLIGMVAVIVVGLAIWATLTAIQCIIMSGALKRLPPAYRRQEPGNVWLLFIPCFSIVWAFFVLPRVSQSLRAYFNSVGRNDVGDCGEGLGLASCIVYVCSLIPIPYLSTAVGITWFVLLIIYLVKVNGLKNQIPVDAAFQTQSPPEPYQPGFPSP
jgi:hypothetical protein